MYKVFLIKLIFYRKNETCPKKQFEALNTVLNLISHVFVNNEIFLENSLKKLFK
jgi:hypothetical protein